MKPIVRVYFHRFTLRGNACGTVRRLKQSIGNGFDNARKFLNWRFPFRAGATRAMRPRECFGNLGWRVRVDSKDCRRRAKIQT
jgi:hypothetical protein